MLVIAGDFNLHMDDPMDADARKFSDLFGTSSLIQHVNFATHVSGPWLDLFPEITDRPLDDDDREGIYNNSNNH